MTKYGSHYGVPPGDTIGFRGFYEQSKFGMSVSKLLSTYSFNVLLLGYAELKTIPLKGNIHDFC